MNQGDIIKRLRDINLDTDEYWVITGGAMVLYGIREETHDIDLGCSKKLADQLADQGYPVTFMRDGTRKISFADDVEIFENWLFGDVIMLNDIPVISMDGLIEMKKSLGREKDRKDLKRIEEFLMK